MERPHAITNVSKELKQGKEMLKIDAINIFFINWFIVHVIVKTNVFFFIILKKKKKKGNICVVDRTSCYNKREQRVEKDKEMLKMYAIFTFLNIWMYFACYSKGKMFHKNVILVLLTNHILPQH